MLSYEEEDALKDFLEKITERITNKIIPSITELPEIKSE